MTTDTAMALLAEAQANIPPHSQLCNTYLENGGTPCNCHLPELYKRITALLDSSIKDAGDDLVEPERIKYIRVEVECGNLRVYKDFIDHIDTLLSAYKRVCVERDAEKERANTLQSIKSQPVPVEPVRDEYECYDHYVDALKDYADSLQSALKVAQQERVTYRNKNAINEQNAIHYKALFEKAEQELDRKERMSQGNFELYKRTIEDLDKAEAENAALRLELARLDGEIPYGN